MIYETDFFTWTRQQSKFLSDGEYEKLDMINLIEELNSLGNSKESSLESYLIILLLHMLKIRCQPEKHTRSWDLSIKNSKFKANRLLKKNPGLKGDLDDTFSSAYVSARLGAESETGLNEEVFPEKCPWTIEEVLR